MSKVYQKYKFIKMVDLLTKEEFVTSIKRAEQLLKKYPSRYKKAIDYSPENRMVTDYDNKSL